jgi:hypothetical protein
MSGWLFMAVELLSSSLQEAKKLPVPEPAKQKESEAIIRDIFKDEYARRSPAERISLARTLIKEAARTKDDPASKFVLLRQAKDLAVEGGDFTLALHAWDELAQTFAGDFTADRISVLTAAAKGAKSVEDFQRLARWNLDLAETALGGEQLEVAEKALDQALASAKKGKDMPAVAKAEARLKDLAALRAWKERVARAREALAKNPEDPAANLALGQNLCMVQGNWEAGLKHLVKGDDPGLKTLATRDLARPLEPQEQLSLGDGWWDRAEKEMGSIRTGARARAVYWYEHAFGKLTGLHRARALKRLQESGSPVTDQTLTVDLLSLVDPQADAVIGTWKLADGNLISPATSDGFSSCEIPYSPPEEYDLTLVAERRGGNSSLLVGLIGGGKLFDMELDGRGGEFSGLDRIDGKWGRDNETRFRGGIFAYKVPHTFVVQVRAKRVVVHLDGQEVVSWDADYRRVSPHPSISLKRSDCLFLGSWQSEFAILKFTLKQVTGEGKIGR